MPHQRANSPKVPGVPHRCCLRLCDLYWRSLQQVAAHDPVASSRAPWADRVEFIDAKYSGPWELPGIGPVAAPDAVLIRPDGYVAWVGEGTQAGLTEALARWFRPGT